MRSFLIGVLLFSSSMASALEPSQFPKLPLKKFLTDATQGEPTYFEALKKPKRDKGKHVNVADHPGATIEGKFVGKIRPFRYLGCKKPIAGAFQACFGEPDFLSHYEKEVLASTDGEQVWIPIQKELFSDFKKEVKKGAKVAFQIRYWGYLVGVKPTDDSLLVFAVGFDSYE